LRCAIWVAATPSQRSAGAPAALRDAPDLTAAARDYPAGIEVLDQLVQQTSFEALTSKRSTPPARRSRESGRTWLRSAGRLCKASSVLIESD
jgi:hypothetical protein